MRMTYRWCVGAFVATVIAMSFVTTAFATPINGALFWRDSAEVDGFLHVDPASNTILVHQVTRGAPAMEYAWTMAAETIHLTVNARHEPHQLGGYTITARNGPSWQNETFDLNDVLVTVELTPTRDFGATAVVRKADGEMSARIAPAEAGTALVRSVEPRGPLMTVPGSTDPKARTHSYEYRAPLAETLEITTDGLANVQGSISTAFFGWRITIVRAGEPDLVVQTGIDSDRDPTTGREVGKVVRYATFTADQGEVTLPPFGGQTTFYTPTLFYDGHAEYPSGLYHGRHQELAPKDQERMDLDGAIVLQAFEENPFEQSYVRAWGEADWVAAHTGSVAAVAPASSAVPLFVAAGGLFLGTQLVPSLMRGLRMGGFLLYARLREQNVNANPTRERIFEAIKVEAGLNLSRLVERLDIGWGTAAYHVQVLKRQGRVKELRFLNRVCFFASEGHEESKQVATVLLRQPNYREVMTVLEAQPGLSQREVAAKTGHARQYISRLVAKMERAGLLRAQASRTGRMYFPHGGVPPGPMGEPFLPSSSGAVSPIPSVPPTTPTMNASTQQH